MDKAARISIEYVDCKEQRFHRQVKTELHFGVCVDYASSLANKLVFSLRTDVRRSESGALVVLLELSGFFLGGYVCLVTVVLLGLLPIVGSVCPAVEWLTWHNKSLPLLVLSSCLYIAMHVLILYLFYMAVVYLKYCLDSILSIYHIIII